MIRKNEGLPEAFGSRLGMRMLKDEEAVGMVGASRLVERVERIGDGDASRGQTICTSQMEALVRGGVERGRWWRMENGYGGEKVERRGEGGWRWDGW